MMRSEPPRVAKQISAADLQCLLRSPLARLHIATPDINTCEELSRWTGNGPIGDVKHRRLISGKPHRYLNELLGSLKEVDDFWISTLEKSDAYASSSEERDAIKADIETRVFEPLKRLRQALNDCAHLVEERPEDFKDNWRDTALGLHYVFRWIVCRSGANKAPGLSKGGPAMAFVMAALKHLEWTPTEDAVLKFLTRQRSGTNRPQPLVQDKSMGEDCPVETRRTR